MARFNPTLYQVEARHRFNRVMQIGLEDTPWNAWKAVAVADVRRMHPPSLAITMARKSVWMRSLISAVSEWPATRMRVLERSGVRLGSGLPRLMFSYYTMLCASYLRET
jgi:hypothetical protein